MNKITSAKLQLANVILDLENALINQTEHDTINFPKETIISLIKELRQVRTTFKDII